MKAGGVLLSVVIIVGALAAVVWIGRYREVPIEAGDSNVTASAQTTVTNGEEDESSDVEPPPPISDTPPYPKVVVEETIYDFGAMGIGEEKTHSFVIKNEGPAPLLMSKGKTNCKCTISELGQREVPEGETAEITLSWRPTELAEIFRKKATIQTNDPEQPTVDLQISGRVTKAIVLTPSHRWDIGDVLEDHPAEITASMYSEIVDEFNVLSIESSHPLLTAEATPLTAEELQLRKAKTGYAIKAVLSPGIPVGRFEAELTIQTDLSQTDLSAENENEEDGQGGDTGRVFVVDVTAFRPGPIRIFAPQNANWYARRMALLMGQFPASEGRTSFLPLFVSDLDEEFKLLSVDSDLEFLKVTLEPDDRLTTKARQAFMLKFEIPPGSPPIARPRGEGAEVVLHTNHRQADKIRIFVEFIAL